MKLRFRTVVLLAVVILTAIAIVVVTSLPVLNQQSEPNPTNNPSVLSTATGNSTTWYKDANQKVIIVVFKQLPKVTYTGENAQSLKNEADLQSWSAAVNGMFFIGSFVDATPAGALQINGKQIVKPVASSDQVNQVVVLDYLNNFVQIISTTKFNMADFAGNKNITYFQTGPLLFNNNTIQQQQILQAPNGQESALRSAIGKLNSGEYFFAVSRVGFNLKDFSEYVTGQSSMSGQVSNMVNLDGGSSTSIYSSEFKDFSFRESTRIPMVIGVE